MKQSELYIYSFISTGSEMVAATEIRYYSLWQVAPKCYETN